MIFNYIKPPLPIITPRIEFELAPPPPCQLSRHVSSLTLDNWPGRGWRIINPPTKRIKESRVVQIRTWTNHCQPCHKHRPQVRYPSLLVNLVGLVQEGFVWKPPWLILITGTKKLSTIFLYGSTKFLVSACNLMSVFLRMPSMQRRVEPLT